MESGSMLSSSRFQSTLPRGERRKVGFWHGIAEIYFNPRSREGSDLDPQVAASLFLQISIHAPARGATTNHGSPFRISIHFNPRSREGSDGASCTDRFSGIQFQSTLPRGERRVLLLPDDEIIRFQSTLPRGERRG